MGTYYIIVNHDQEEYINPHDMGGGAKSIEIMLPSKASIATAILLSDKHYNHARAGTWDYAESVNDGYDEDLYYDIKDNYTNVSYEMLNFINSNNIGEEDWMEDVLREKFDHDAWGEYEAIQKKYELNGNDSKSNAMEALRKIGELTVNIDEIPDFNDPNTTEVEIEKVHSEIYEKPIVFEIAMGRPDLTEENKEYYMKIRRKLMQSVAKFGDSMSKEDLEKLVELSESMTYALHGYTVSPTIMESLEKYEKQMQNIVNK